MKFIPAASSCAIVTLIAGAAFGQAIGVDATADTAGEADLEGEGDLEEPEPEPEP
jgi:hypothetical protein